MRFRGVGFEHSSPTQPFEHSSPTQPEDEAALWNPKGYVNNASPPITVHAVSPDERSRQPDG